MIKTKLKNKIANLYPDANFDILIPPDDKMGDYSTNIAFAKEPKNPMKLGEELASVLNKDKEFNEIFEKIEAVKPGFVNFYLKNDFLQEKLGEVSREKNYGFNETMKGKTVMVEYTDPNPFKLFHIGHLMSNTIGEATARLYEASGAKVLRANYQGDVGLHVAKAIWGMLNMEYGTWNMEHVGEAYAKGAKAYEEDESVKKDIEEINAKIYDRSDEKINKLYDLGKKLSLEYFETIYSKLGTKFDRYFFESQVAQDGLQIVEKHPDVFVESNGAKVFKGEEYDLHTRVFVSSKGLPTYEAKELGVNKKKFQDDDLDLSVIITGNEINEYFKVLLKAMELTMPEVAEKTKHISHGMLRLPEGKMSSRTGDVITAEALIEETKSRLPASPAGRPESENDEIPILSASQEQNRGSSISQPNQNDLGEIGTKEKIAIGAVKYSILKQSPGHDIVFDFDKSLSIKGDSAPYLQYTYARLNSILEKDKQINHKLQTTNYKLLEHETELKLIKQILMFPDVVFESREGTAPQHLALYLYELSNEANRFYESVRVLESEKDVLTARLSLVKITADVLKKGLNLLGIETPDRI